MTSPIGRWLVFAMPPWGDVPKTDAAWDIRHGRIETRILTTSAALVDFSDWPGLRQVFQFFAIPPLDCCGGRDTPTWQRRADSWLHNPQAYWPLWALNWKTE